MAKLDKNEVALRAGYQAALRAFIAKLPNPDDKFGAEANFARAIGVSRQLVFYWRRKGISPKHVMRVSEITGLPPEKIRPYT